MFVLDVFPFKVEVEKDTGFEIEGDLGIGGVVVVKPKHCTSVISVHTSRVTHKKRSDCRERMMLLIVNK